MEVRRQNQIRPLRHEVRETIGQRFGRCAEGVAAEAGGGTRRFRHVSRRLSGAAPAAPTSPAAAAADQPEQIPARPGKTAHRAGKSRLWIARVLLPRRSGAVEEEQTVM